MSQRKPPETTVKTTEAKQLLMEVETKNSRMRAIGLVMLFVVCVGVITSVILASVIFNRQSQDRRAEAARREQQARDGNLILNDIFLRLNHADQLISEHVGKEPLPPLQLPSSTTPTTTRRRATTTTTVRSTTTTSPSTTTTSTTQAPTTTTTQPPTTTTTSPRICVGVVCVP